MDALQATYLSRRLAETRRMQDIAASIRFDLARSGLDDDQLEQAVSTFAGEQAPQSGWGWSAVLDDLMSRAPERVPVTDMKTFQSNLINLGYASPLTVATGTWDPSWYGAARRFDRDMFEAQMSGKTMLAAPLRAGVELLGQTLPSNIFRNIVGWAKGFAEQTPETVSRIGALGGAASGAAIGGIVGGPIGAGVGALAGGAIGFFGDLLTKDDGEAPDESFWGSFVDALAPFGEYAANPKAFWEDLGYVGTVASVIGGAKLAVSGVQGALASRAGLAASLEGGAATADVQLGLPGNIIRWGTKTFAPNSLGAVESAIARVSPVANFAKIPGAKLVNPIFTGASTASVGIHLTAGLGQGSREMNADIRTQAAALVRAATEEGRQLTPEEMDLIDRANRGVGVGTIEKAISETTVPGNFGSLNAGPQVFGMPLSDWLLPSNLLDIGSFFLWPEKLLPIVPGAISKTIGKAADVPLGSIARSWSRLTNSEHMLRPWVQYFQGDGISSAQARAFVKEELTPAMDAFVRLDAGTKMRVAKQLHEAKIDAPKILVTAGQERFNLIGKFIEEGEAGSSPTALAVFGETVVRPESLLAHLIETKPEGITRRQAFLNYKAALKETADAESIFRAEAGVSHEIMVGEGGKATRVQVARLPEGVMTVPYGKVSFVPDAAELEQKAQIIDAQIAKLRDSQFASGASPKSLIERNAEITELERQAKSLRDLATSDTRYRLPQEYRLVPARLDTPTRGDYYGMKHQLRALHEKLYSLGKQLKGATGEAEHAAMGTPAYLQASQELRDLVDGWLAKGYISEALRDSALHPRANGKFSQALDRMLDASAKAAAVDADVPPALRQRLEGLGYKPVLTGENMILPTEAERWVEATGIGDYTRRRAFFDMIGVREDRVRDNDLWKVRVASERSELQQVVEAEGLQRTAHDVYGKLYEHLEEINHSGVVRGPLNLSKTHGNRLFMVDVRSLKPQDIMEALDDILPEGREWEVAMNIYGALKRGAAYGGDWKGISKIATARSIGHALGLSGLPGFSDVIRTFHAEDPLAWGSKGISANKLSKAKYAAAGAAAGAVVGAIEGDQELSDAFAGAAIGAAAGLGLRYFNGKAYGYLPDLLVRANTALRYTLSLTFDAGRYSEQNLIAMTKYGLPPMFSPKRKLAAMGELKTPYGTGKVAGEAAWNDAIQFWDDVNGTSWFRSLDDTDRRMYQAGLLGFQPRNWEAAQAFMLYQRGWGKAKIEEAIKNIGRYGVGRSAAEKSANFVFFPFSFSKKLLSTLGDFAISAPGRNLMIYEGLRRYYESTLDEDFHQIIEDHFPLLEQLSKVNNLAYGVSPGRFFLAGLGDQRTNFGRAAAVLTQFFVPSGAATPLMSMAGTTADLAVNMFVPVVVTGEAIDRLGGMEGFDDVISRYIPLSREITQYWTAVNEQKTAFLQGATPWAQVQDYLDEKRAFTDSLRPMATIMGYASPEGFLQSNAGLPWKAQYDQLNLELDQRYPSARNTLGGFEDKTQASAQILYELANKEERSAGEDAILDLAKVVETYERMKTVGLLPTSMADRVESLAVRNEALKHADDRRFAELYQLLFMRSFGPLEVAA